MFRQIRHSINKRRLRARREATIGKFFLLNSQIENWSRYYVTSGRPLSEDPYVHDFILGFLQAHRRSTGCKLFDGIVPELSQEPFLEYLTSRLGCSGGSAGEYFDAAMARRVSGSEGYRDGLEVGRNLISRANA